jgi:sporulation protein YlmC with PRC-barrel domain
MVERKFSRNVLGKSVVSKAGRNLGIVGDLLFEVRTGELIHFVLDKPTVHVERLNIERGKGGELLVPFSAVTATEDFVIIAEEDVI